jgi:hypothetical protein
MQRAYERHSHSRSLPALVIRSLRLTIVAQQSDHSPKRSRVAPVAPSKPAGRVIACLRLSHGRWPWFLAQRRH